MFEMMSLCSSGVDNGTKRGKPIAQATGEKTNVSSDMLFRSSLLLSTYILTAA